MKIDIIGDGVWGKALYSVIQNNNTQVSIHGKSLTETHADIVLLCVPIKSQRDVVKKIKNKKAIIINTTKGIERDTHKLPYQITEDLLGTNVEYFSLIGPSFAEEVMQKMPTLVNLGYKNDKNLKKIIKMFQTEYFRVEPTPYLRAIELAGALKNVYAIGCGIIDGLGYRTNTRAKFITFALREIYSLLAKLGYASSGCMPLPGIEGDLFLTCSSNESRNYTFGQKLITFSAEEYLRQTNLTIEGFFTVQSIPFYKQKTASQLPLATFVFDCVCNKDPKKLPKLFSNFFQLL